MGRMKLLGMTFNDYEKEIKEHLTGLLGPEGFDAEKDISAITVNRWPHGYTYEGTGIYDQDMKRIAEEGRKKFGRITIANADSGSSAFMDAAIDQAWRAVKELD